MKDIYFEGSLFNYSRSTDLVPNQKKFMLHNHNDKCEILIFIKGNSEFRVEGATYDLNPLDIVITHGAEMHRIYHLMPLSEYERIVINIHNRFFTKNHCEDFGKIFTGRRLGSNNLISGSIATKSGILDIVESIERYIAEDNDISEVVIKSKIVELLYVLNKTSPHREKIGTYDRQVRSILMYINENIASPLSLDMLAEHFYINKYHLCHIFKEQTGFTVNKYITHKRILMVRDLCAEGKSLIEASAEAGFGNYSNFYKMYKKETGKSPKEDLAL